MTSAVDWKSHRDDDGIQWLVLDKADGDTNVLSISILEQLDQLIDEIERDLPRAVVFRSGKRGGFIAGADVNEFLDVESTEDALAMVYAGEDGVHGVVVALEERIELVIVTAGAAEGDAEEGFAGGAEHFVDGVGADDGGLGGVLVTDVVVGSAD